MNNQQASRYLRTQVQTASKEQLLLMLFDGGVRFAEQAKVQLNEGRYEPFCRLLVQAERIVIELMSVLAPEEIDPVLYDNLMGLYNFVYQKLCDANLQRSLEALEEAISILQHLRKTWADAIRDQSTGLELKNLPRLSSHPNSSGLCIEG